MQWDSMGRRLIGSAMSGPRRMLALLYVLLAFVVLSSLTVPSFFSPGNFLNIGLHASILLIVSLGMTFSIIGRGIDLSVGAVLGLSGVVMAFLLQSGMALPLAITAGVLTGALCGAINGTLIGYGRLAPFIATFGMMGMASSVALVLSNGTSIAGFPPALLFIGGGQVAGIPMPLLTASALFLVMLYVQGQTRFGTWVYAMGGNEEGVLLAGISVARQKLLIYTLAGLLAGVGGVVLAGRLNSAQPTVGLGMEFDAIAAVIMGGTPFSGGEGGVGRTLIGALILNILQNILNLLGFPTSWQLLASGLAIILSISVEAQLDRARATAEGA